AAVEHAESETALAELNGKLLDILGESSAPEDQRRRFHRLRAAAMYLEMRAQGLQSQANYRRVLDELASFEALGGELDAAEIARSIEAHLALGDNDRAIELVNRIDPSDAERRQRMLKLVIRAAMDDLEAEQAASGDADLHADVSGGAGARFEQALGLLTRLAADPSLDERDRIWTIARQAELRLAAGYNAETVAHLLREMQRIDSLRTEEAGELYVLLGRAYFNLGQYDEAAQRLDQADVTLSPTDQNRSTTNVLLGRIAMLRGDAELARDRFAFVTTSFGGAKDVDEAWLGLAEAEAVLGNFEPAAEAYRVLVENLRRANAPDAVSDQAAPAHGPPATAPIAARALESLRGLANDRLDANDPGSTLRFAQIAESLGGPEHAPEWCALLQARALRTQADALAAAAAPD